MATEKERIEFERNKPIGTVRLILVGTFYRAYNESAYLFQQVINRYRVSRSFSKSLGEFVYMVGFPQTGLRSNAQDRHLEQTECGVDIYLKDSDRPAVPSYEQWKTETEFIHKSESDLANLPVAGIEAEAEVIKRLRSFNLESKTPIETFVFVAELRQLLNTK